MRRRDVPPRQHRQRDTALRTTPLGIRSRLMAARRPPDWPHQERRSIPYFPDALPEPADRDPTAYMFVEDIGLGILPNGCEVRLEPAHEAQTIAAIFPTRDELFRERFSERINDFIEESARSLAERGEFWYELVRPPAGMADPTPPFVLARLPPGKITPLPWWFIQHVPGPSRARAGRGYIAIPRRDTWHVTLPSELGTPREHRTLVRFLGSSLFPPELALEAMRPGATTGYDFTVHRQAHQALVAAATRRWGWTGRGIWSEESSQYFMDYRAIRFRRAQVLIRTHIINEVNTLLEREGITARIIVEGLTTTDMIDTMLSRLREGTATTDEALNLLRQ